MADYSSNPKVKYGEEKGKLQDEGGVLSSLKKMVVLLTTSTIVLLALRNTITYHLQHFWGASGNFWQHQWDKILDLCGNDDFNLIVYGPTFACYIAYWIPGTLFTIMDLTNKPSFLRPYKIQPGTHEPVSVRAVIKCFLRVSFNQIAAGLLFSNAGYYLINLRGYDRSPQLPTFHWVLFELAVCTIMVELGFYYFHRMFHHRLLYKHIHKLHHEWQSPIAISALDCHPLEHIVANLAPVFLGPLVMGSHIGTLWLWSTLASMNTIYAHCGYHLPFFQSNEFHNYHHLKFNQCFGVLGILDHLHGTDDKFRASRSYMRHVTMLSMIPPRVMYPDVDPDAKLMKGKTH